MLLKLVIYICDKFVMTVNVKNVLFQILSEFSQFFNGSQTTIFM